MRFPMAEHGMTVEMRRNFVNGEKLHKDWQYILIILSAPMHLA